MKHLYSPQPVELASLQIESSPVWEIILGISGYTHKQLRHTFDFDEYWCLESTTMPKTLVEYLEIVQEYNFWYGLLMIQNKLSAMTVKEFSEKLSNMSDNSFYDSLLPYKDRETEPIRKSIADNYQNRESFKEYATHFQKHNYLGNYINSLAQYSSKELRRIFTQTLTHWYNWISQQTAWKKWMRALNFEQKQNSAPIITNHFEKIEQITGGIKYQPEPSIWTVKLIPHVSYRPWVLEARTCDTKLFFYPLKIEHLMEPGIPAVDLVRGHKALGDELRLKLLYNLLQGSLSLQELSVQFNISKTTLHHQLSLLKAAKFVTVEKGIYSANSVEIKSFSERISQYLQLKV